MSFLKKIFGENKSDKKKEFEVITDPVRNQKIESDLQAIKVGDVYKIYPILKPGDWIGIKAGALRQTIIGDKENPKLVVGFGYDAPNNFVFLKYSDVREAKLISPNFCPSPPSHSP